MKQKRKEPVLSTDVLDAGVQEVVRQIEKTAAESEQAAAESNARLEALTLAYKEELQRLDMYVTQAHNLRVQAKTIAGSRYA